MVAIIDLVVCQEEEFIFLYKESIPTGRESGIVGSHGMRGSHRVMFWRRACSQPKENKGLA